MSTTALALVLTARLAGVAIGLTVQAVDRGPARLVRYALTRRP